MSRMSDLDLMVQDGARTARDFIERGFDARTARAMAEVVAASERQEPYDTLREFDLIDADGFYTIYETKR